MISTKNLTARQLNAAVEILATFIWVIVFIYIVQGLSYYKTAAVYGYMAFVTGLCFLFHTVPVIKAVLQKLNTENIFISQLAVLEAEKDLECVETTFGYIGAIVAAVAMLQVFLPKPSLGIYIGLVWVFMIVFTISISMTIVKRLLKNSKFLAMELVMQPLLAIANFLWISALGTWLFF